MRQSKVLTIGEVLVDHDVVQSSKAFVNAARDNPQSSSIQPGTYRLLTKMTAADAVAALLTNIGVYRCDYPVLSQILTERRPGLATLYVCPLRALLNNLHRDR